MALDRDADPAMISGDTRPQGGRRAARDVMAFADGLADDVALGAYADRIEEFERSVRAAFRAW